MSNAIGGCEWKLPKRNCPQCLKIIGIEKRSYWVSIFCMTDLLFIALSYGCTHRNKIRYLIIWPIPEWLHHVKIFYLFSVTMHNGVASYGTQTSTSNIIIVHFVLSFLAKSVRYPYAINNDCYFSITSKISYLDNVFLLWHYNLMTILLKMNLF